ncbi:hypothetical protein ACOMHN_017593 [Nucella lapillus]
MLKGTLGLAAEISKEDITLEMPSTVVFQMKNVIMSEPAKLEHPLEKHPLEEHPLEKHPQEKHPLEKHPLEEHPLEKYPLEKHTLEKHPLGEHPLEKHPLEEHIQKWRNTHWRNTHWRNTHSAVPGWKADQGAGRAPAAKTTTDVNPYQLCLAHVRTARLQGMVNQMCRGLQNT